MKEKTVIVLRYFEEFSSCYIHPKVKTVINTINTIFWIFSRRQFPCEIIWFDTCIIDKPECLLEWSLVTRILKLQGFSKNSYVFIVLLPRHFALSKCKRMYWDKAQMFTYNSVYICEWTDGLIISGVAIYSWAQSSLVTRHWEVLYFPNRMI